MPPGRAGSIWSFIGAVAMLDQLLRGGRRIRAKRLLISSPASQQELELGVRRQAAQRSPERINQALRVGRAPVLDRLARRAARAAST